MFLGHVTRGEVTEGRVLRFGQKLVVGNLERLGASSVKNVLEMILKDHAASKVGLSSRSHSHRL